MPITPDDFTGSDENGRRRLLVIARSIAPCLDSLKGSAREDAIAVLSVVAAEVPASGSRRTKSMSRNGTSITFDGYESAFTHEDRVALRSLCAAASTDPPAGLPEGSFPAASSSLEQEWPEEYP